MLPVTGLYNQTGTVQIFWYHFVKDKDQSLYLIFMLFLLDKFNNLGILKTGVCEMIFSFPRPVSQKTLCLLSFVAKSLYFYTLKLFIFHKIVILVEV